MFKEKIKALISKGSGEENNGNNKKKIENLVVFILILIKLVKRRESYESPNSRGSKKNLCWQCSFPLDLLW